MRQELDDSIDLTHEGLAPLLLGPTDIFSHAEFEAVMNAQEALRQRFLQAEVINPIKGYIGVDWVTGIVEPRSSGTNRCASAARKR